MPHGGRVYAVARARGLDAEALTDLSASLNPLGPPASVRPTLQDPVPWLRHYPDGEHTELRHVLAERFAVDPASLWCGNGSSDVLADVVAVVRPRRLVLLEPAFAEYRRIADRAGIPTAALVWDQERLRWPLSALDTLLQPGDLLVFSHPHNPSGLVWPRRLWADRVRSWLARNVRIVVDEAFMDFVDDAAACTALPLVADGLIVVRSATKIFGLPGLRLGFGIGPPAIAETVRHTADPWRVSQLAQEVYRIAYQDQPFRDATAAWLQDALAWLGGTWQADPRLYVAPTRVNFFLVRFPSDAAAAAVAETLERHRILVRRCRDFRGLGDRWLRLALSTDAVNQKAWAYARAALDHINT
jgi:threonine-phosphate decarboxylase